MMETPDVQNGPLINRRTIVHFSCVTLRFILKDGENRFSDGNNGRAERNVIHFLHFKLRHFERILVDGPYRRSIEGVSYYWPEKNFRPFASSNV